MENLKPIPRQIELDPQVRNLDQYPSIGVVDVYKIPETELKGYFLKISRDKNKDIDKSLFLYLFPGQKNNDEWRTQREGYIEKLMYYIMRHIKKHPSMTIVMPYLYYHGDGHKVEDAQNITQYIEKIVTYFEGEGEWDNHDSYKRRAVGGLCLGALSALKCALHWEKFGQEKFFSVGVLSPAGDAEAGRWLDGKPNFKFTHPQKHRLYLSYGSQDLKRCHAELYAQYFHGNNSSVDDYVVINRGLHDWDAFNTGFVDYMSKEIFDHEYYMESNSESPCSNL